MVQEEGEAAFFGLGFLDTRAAWKPCQEQKLILRLRKKGVVKLPLRQAKKCAILTFGEEQDRESCFFLKKMASSASYGLNKASTLNSHRVHSESK